MTCTSQEGAGSKGQGLR